MNRFLPLHRLALLLLLTGASLVSGCAHHVNPSFTSLRPPRERLIVPSKADNLVLNGSFEELKAGEPVGWDAFGANRKGVRLRIVDTSREGNRAPDGRHVAEISMDAGEEATYGLIYAQDVRVLPGTTYDLSVWVRGIDLVSGVGPPHGYGQHCGFTFWLYGPQRDFKHRRFGSGAYPRSDGTTPWELRKMRFTLPPTEAFPAAEPGGDGRLIFALRVQLFGTGRIQVDDLRMAPATAGLPPPRRGPGQLAQVRYRGEPLFGMGIHRVPEGLDRADVAAEKIFNFYTGPGKYAENLSLGLLSISDPSMVNPACRGCGSEELEECRYCRGCPEQEGKCKAYSAVYLQTAAALGVWMDEHNVRPTLWGSLEEQIRTSRKIKSEAARLRGPHQPYYILSSDMPGAVYYNTYGWDDLARYHASEAYDIVGTIRRGGNPPPGAVGGRMSEFPNSGVNGIRQSTRRVADDITDRRGRQAKPVWMIVNGGNSKIVTDPEDPKYPASPHTPEELQALRPDRDQLRYQLYTAILNGATGLFFYQDSNDSRLTAEDPFWNEVLIPAAAELATLEQETGFLTQPHYNPRPFRVEGDSPGVDLMMKSTQEGWILVATNSYPEPVEGLKVIPEWGEGLEGPVERLVYRHQADPAQRGWMATPLPTSGQGHLTLQLPGYGVALHRFRVRESISSDLAAD